VRFAKAGGEGSRQIAHMASTRPDWNYTGEAREIKERIQKCRIQKSRIQDSGKAFPGS